MRVSHCSGLRGVTNGYIFAQKLLEDTMMTVSPEALMHNGIQEGFIKKGNKTSLEV